MGRFVIDSCVLIDVLRGHRPALSFLRSLDDAPLVSTVTIGELFAGAHRRGEEALIVDLVTQLDIVPLEFGIARLVGKFCRQYGPSHGVALIDATIAATAELCRARLATRNARHFPMLDDVLVPYS